MKRILLCVIVIGTLASLWFMHALSPLDAGNAKPVAVRIDSGSSVSTIAAKLSDADLIRSALAFKLHARLTGNASRLQAGVFALSPSQSVSEIIAVIVSGKSEAMNVTIPEGLTVAEIDRLLASKGLGKEGDILDCAYRCDFSTFEFLPTKAALTPTFAKSSVGRPSPSPLGGGENRPRIGSRLEGYLFPETYSVSTVDYVPKFFLERMLGTFRKRILDTYYADMMKTGRPLSDFVTMASLVESESRHAEERAVVAGILWKRLSSHVVLAVDATTRYEIQNSTGSLSKADLNTPTPYNTRRRQGLPAGPISNPGESSFIAALKPKSSPYWYYLHDAEGRIHYAVTNDEHNANKAKYVR